jgi:hypothetical protein
LGFHLPRRIVAIATSFTTTVQNQIHVLCRLLVNNDVYANTCTLTCNLLSIYKYLYKYLYWYTSILYIVLII